MSYKPFEAFLFQSVFVLQCLELCNYRMSVWVANLKKDLENFQQTNSTANSYPFALQPLLSDLIFYLTVYFLSDITRQSYNKRAHLKTSRPWIAAFWEFNFSLALFKDLARSSCTFDHHWSTVLTPFLQAQELRLRFPPVTFEGSVWS